LALRKDNDLAGLEWHRLPAGGGGEASPRGHDMIGDQMIRARQNLRQNQVAGRRRHGPWTLRRNLKEHGARQPNGFQHIG
jgi:hypothetical protein